MEVKYLSHSSPYNMWTTCIPRNNSSCYSPKFDLNGHSCYFQLQMILGACSQDEMWSLRFYRKGGDTNNLDNFHISIFAKTRGGCFDFIGCPKVIASSKETYILLKMQSSLALQHQQVDFSGPEITFMFIFDFVIRDFVGVTFSTVKEHKFVQTLSSIDGRQGSLSTDLCKLMDEGSNSDLQVKCGEETFLAHRLILCARSVVFQAMLQSDMREGRENLIEISDMEPGDFKLFLQYLYTDALPELTVHTASSLYEAGDKYQLKGLQRHCRDFLAENLTSTNAARILVMAEAHCDKDLKESALSFLSNENIPDKVEEWKNFSRQHPQLACDVFLRVFKKAKTS